MDSVGTIPLKAKKFNFKFKKILKLQLFDSLKIFSQFIILTYSKNDLRAVLPDV